MTIPIIPMNKKAAFTEYTVSTPTSDFAIGFDYAENVNNLRVRINDVPIKDTAYNATLINPLTIQITPPVTTGIVRINRETDIDENLHKFSGGALFNATSMDKNFEQIRNSQQELRDEVLHIAHADQLQANIDAEEAARIDYDNRALRFPLAEGIDANEFPNAATRANKFPVFDINGQVSLSSGTGTDVGLRGDLATPTGTSLIGFLQAGTGAVLRTVQSKLRDVVSVKDFGAVGDGIADDTAAIQLALNSGASRVTIPKGTYIISNLIIPSSCREFVGSGSANIDTFLKRKVGATGAAIAWNGTNRVTQAFIGHFRIDGNGEASETYGLDLSGFSYCTFENIWVRAFKLDGIYVDGSSTPVSKQFSNNTFINVRSTNNLRDGWRFDDFVNSNSANVYIGCEGSGNAGRGWNDLFGNSNQCTGCTFQGNTGRDFYTNGQFGVYDFYMEGNVLGCEFGALSEGNHVSVRSAYPSWNTFLDNGIQNKKNTRGFSGVFEHIFNDPFSHQWVTAAPPPRLITAGTVTYSSAVDANSPQGHDLVLTIGGNFSGTKLLLNKPLAELQGKWVTVVADVDTSGVTGTPNLRCYAAIDDTNNTAAGQFVVRNLEITGAGTYKKLFFDIKFGNTAGTTPRIILYFIYDGYTSSSVIKVRSLHVLMGRCTEFSALPLNPPVPSITAAELGVAANGVNVHRKTEGRTVFDSTNGKLRFAVGTTPTSVWRATDGSGDITPA